MPEIKRTAAETGQKLKIKEQKVQVKRRAQIWDGVANVGGAEVRRILGPWI
jgi:hypothetical protein